MTEIHTLYLVHNSHTDIGYTHEQPIVWEMHNRILWEALDLAERYADQESDGAFRWTVETTSVLLNWLKHASVRDIERFIALERAGRIEVTGMFVNITPLYDIDQLMESLQVIGHLRETYGLRITSAMNCDVNGVPWPLVDLLLDAGIGGFSMAINPHSGGPLRPRPHVFWWEGPSGRRLPTLNGWPYDKGWALGIGRDIEEFEQVWWPRAIRYLDEIGYPLPILMLQTLHPFGDNCPPLDYTATINAWNSKGKGPRIIMATPRDWWQAVQPYLAQLPTLRGDWTDFWSFGTMSSAREEGLARQSRGRLRTADALYAALHALPVNGARRWIDHSYPTYRAQAWEMLHLWGEHTWGVDDSVWQPDSDDTASGWYHKAYYGYNARSLSLLLQRDALAELARYLPTGGADTLLVFNPLPWERTLSGSIPPAQATPRGSVDDGTSSRHHLDRAKRHRWHEEDLLAQPEEARQLLPPTRVPGFGYTLVKRADLLVRLPVHDQRDTAVIENQRFRLRVNRECGGIVSLYDKCLDWEWANQGHTYALNTVVHEEVADHTHPKARDLQYKHQWPTENVEIPIGWRPDWRARRTCPQELLSHTVYETPLGQVITQTLRLNALPAVIHQRIFLPSYADFVECESRWHMGLTTHPEAVYVLFPLNLPGAVARYDLGGQPVIAGEEQLPAVCRDYFTAQGWVDFSSAQMGMTIALPENPMFQLGDFHFSDYQQTLQLDEATLLAWVVNNYWETNFRAHQPGIVHARYRLLPHTGGFDESAAHRAGLEAQYADPLLQHLGEPRIAGGTLPESGSLLHLPGAPFYVLRVQPGAERGTIMLRLLNASESAQTAVVKSALLEIDCAHQCDFFGRAAEPLTVANGAVTVEIPARRTAVFQFNVHLNKEFSK